MVFGDPCKRVVWPPKEVVTHGLRATALNPKMLGLKEAMKINNCVEYCHTELTQEIVPKTIFQRTEFVWVHFKSSQAQQTEMTGETMKYQTTFCIKINSWTSVFCLMEKSYQTAFCIKVKSWTSVFCLIENLFFCDSIMTSNIHHNLTWLCVIPDIHHNLLQIE